MTHNKTDLLKINNNTKHKIWGKRNLPMLLCIGNLDPKVDEVITVKTMCDVVESAGSTGYTYISSSSTLKNIFSLLICA